MDIKILEEKEVPLLARKKLILEVSYPTSSTPSNDSVKKSIASLLKIKEELVALRHIYPKFGEGKAKVIANIYKNLKDLKEIEEIKKKAKKEKKEKIDKREELKEKIAEKKAEEAKEEVKEEPTEKAEEKKEEKPAESK